MRTVRILAACLAVLLLLPCLAACARDGAPQGYDREHTHVYGHWQDAAPAEPGAPVTREVRYCKICHAEELRDKAP